MKPIEKIYLAGKIDGCDWRYDIVDGLEARSPQHGTPGYDTPLIYGLAKPWPVLMNAIFGRYHYTGPYFVHADHSRSGSFYGDGSHGVGATVTFAYDEDNAEEKHHNTPLVEMGPWVVERCQEAIRTSDLVFAWIDDITCYGTIAELGYAKALGKTIWIAGPKEYRDLWFVYKMADQVHLIYDWRHSRLSIKQVLWDMLGHHEITHPHFDSPIEEAFWEAWFARGFNTVLPLVPQHPIGKYRVDFAHIPTRTAIELDGHATHSSPDAIAYDRQRQRYIESQGWHVIRFGGKEVFKDAGICAREAVILLRNRPIIKQVQKQAQFKAGDKVKHLRFGDGVVIKSEMEFNTEFVEVQFQDDRKRLSMDFAKIEVSNDALPG